jgi:hypothetical protein
MPDPGTGRDRRGIMSDNPGTKEDFDMRKRVSFPALIISNSPKVAIFSALRQWDQFARILCKKEGIFTQDFE